MEFTGGCPDCNTRLNQLIILFSNKCTKKTMMFYVILSQQGFHNGKKLFPKHHASLWGKSMRVSQGFWGTRKHCKFYNGSTGTRPKIIGAQRWTKYVGEQGSKAPFLERIQILQWLNVLWMDLCII